MTYLIGVDEAGYGPNLGPLVIAASVWRVPDHCPADTLYRQLSSAVSASPAMADDRVLIADSKIVYQPTAGIARLERGVWAALGLLKHRPNRWRDIWPCVAPQFARRIDSIPWHGNYDPPLPLEATAAQIEHDCQQLQDSLNKANVQLLAMRGLAIFPDEFNELTEQLGNKGAALSQLSLRLVGELLAELPAGPVSVFCDRHGGRARYAAILQHEFQDCWIEICSETPQASCYQFGPPERRVEIGFRVGGESILPTALASMTAKYLREAAMRAFNHFWLQHLPELQPTAGYPLDARRFKQAIDPVQRSLGISDHVLWRNR